MAPILVADDDPDSRELLAAVFHHMGHEVVLAADGDEALRLYHQHRPAVAVVDIFMPGKDGIEVIRELRAAGAPVKIVAVSGGWHRINLLPEAEHLGADRILTKPLEPLNLVKAVEQLLAG